MSEAKRYDTLRASRMSNILFRAKILAELLHEEERLEVTFCQRTGED